MRSLQTAMIIILTIIAIVLFALGGFILGMGNFNGDDKYNDKSDYMERDINKLKSSQQGLNEQLLLLQAENERLRNLNTQPSINKDYPPLTFIRDNYRTKCDNIEEDIDDLRDDIDNQEEDIDDLRDDIDREIDPVKKATLQAELIDLEDELDDMNNDLDDLYDDEDDENC